MIWNFYPNYLLEIRLWLIFKELILFSLAAWDVPIQQILKELLTFFYNPFLHLYYAKGRYLFHETAICCFDAEYVTRSYVNLFKGATTQHFQKRCRRKTQSAYGINQLIVRVSASTHPIYHMYSALSVCWTNMIMIYLGAEGFARLSTKILTIQIVMKGDKQSF